MNQPDIATYTPGTLLTVGNHRAKILSYITSGGFAQVYSAEMYPLDAQTGTNIACLKRVIVPDKSGLNTLRAEVDAMKLLKNNKHVVCYIDSHAAKSSWQNGTYEVFLLMEYCAGGGLIDFMNTRLQNRLKEYEILNIMSQVTQGIAAMHSLQPPLIHRDIKIENVLISGNGEYKVCDFGSVSGVIRPPRNPQEFGFVQHDILKNTTAQYRSPEMIDLYRCQAIDEKSDIWALGIFLYKLCYYTTPFEKGGEQAILHSRFQFLSHPIYSDRLKNLIGWMLSQQPLQRPNICQVLEEVSRMQGVPSPIKNFYLVRAMQQSSNNASFSGTASPSAQGMTTAIPGALVTSPIAPMVPSQSLGANSLPMGVAPQSLPVMSKARSACSTGGNLLAGIPNPAMSSAQMIPTQFGSMDMTPGILPPFNRTSTFPINTFQVNPAQGNVENAGHTSVFATATSAIKPNNYVDSETQTSDAELAVDKGSEPYLHPSAVSSTRSLPSSRKTFGEERPRSSSLDFRSASRQKASDEEIVENLTALSSRRDNQAKRQNFTSTGNQKKKSLTGGPNISVSTESLVRIKSNPDAKESIQKKVQSLLKAAESSPNEKAVSEASDSKNFNANDLTKTITNHVIGCTAVENVSTSFPVNDESHSKSKPKAPPPPPKPEHLRPKPPPKPAFLSGKKKQTEKLLDEVKDAIMDSDIDALEKDVRKKIPNTL
ncbi:PRK1 (YIL095W) and ARK1 (YNL020C) [Zygosaccharomyces parabailii]|nr:PRK1 (YIL095W) and ARK1 (YNL020C) [Zygosaccharomyces parabailii]CDH08490.1 related to Actin-regulating kinase PRK1 [Zygosaccharomyces bailii ISA1307]